MLILVVTLSAARARGDDAAVDTITAAPSLGPAASIEAACALVPREADDTDEGFCQVDTTSKDAKKIGKLKLEAPYQQLALVLRDSDGPAAARLAIRAGDQWYLATLAEWGMYGAEHGGMSVTSIKLKDVIPGGAPEILITGGHEDLAESHDYNTFGNRYESLWVCSVGASGAPSCAEVLLGEQRWQHDMSSLKDWRLRLSHKFDKAGRITRKIKGKWPKDRRRDEGEALSDVAPKSDYVNTRTLVFP